MKKNLNFFKNPENEQQNFNLQVFDTKPQQQRQSATINQVRHPQSFSSLNSEIKAGGINPEVASSKKGQHPPVLNTCSKVKKPLNKAILNKIKAAKRSGIINLANMNLNFLPEEIFENDLAFDDINWWEIVDITKIDATNNFITEVLVETGSASDIGEYDFSSIPALNYLKFTNNKFNIIPKSISSLKNLKFLDFSSNNLLAIPIEIARLSSLVDLNCSKNGISVIPPQIGELKQLEVIDFSFNKIQALPNTLAECTKLKRVNFSENLIEQLNLQNFSQSEEMYLFKNRISAISYATELPFLTFFDLHNNQLSNFKVPVAPRLDSLILGYNKLESIENLKSSQNLSILDVNNNQISSFPIEIIGLTKLKTLNIQNNNLNDIPPLLSGLSGLVRLNIEGNPMRKLNSKLRSSNADQIKAYLKTRITEEDLKLLSSIKKMFGSSNENLGMDIDYEGSDEMQQQQINYHSCFHNSYLRISNLGLKEIPFEVTKIPNISSIIGLDISKNKFDSLHSLILVMNTDLKEINAAGNGLTKIFNMGPSTKDFLFKFLNLTSLKILDLRGNNLTSFLENLDIREYVIKQPLIKEEKNQYNFFTNNPKSLYNQPGTEEYIEVKKSDPIDYLMGVFTSLEYLDLSSNKLTIIPNIIILFVNLKSLLLSQNTIYTVDNVLNVNYQFHLLQALDLSSNKIQNFPTKLYLSTPELCSLSLDNNEIKLLPTDLSLLQLKKISISGNPLKQIRMNIIQGGSSAINDYLIKMHNFTDYEKTFLESRTKSLNKAPPQEYSQTLTKPENSVGISPVSKGSNTLIPKNVQSQQGKKITSLNQPSNNQPQVSAHGGGHLDQINNQILSLEHEIQSDPIMEFTKKRDLKAKLISLIRERAKLIK